MRNCPQVFIVIIFQISNFFIMFQAKDLAKDCVQNLYFTLRGIVPPGPLIGPAWYTYFSHFSIQSWLGVRSHQDQSSSSPCDSRIVRNTSGGNQSGDISLGSKSGCSHLESQRLTPSSCDSRIVRNNSGGHHSGDISLGSESGCPNLESLKISFQFKRLQNSLEYF